MPLLRGGNDHAAGNVWDALRMEREINEMYQALFGGYYPDTLTDAQKAELEALVAKWDADGGADDDV